MKISLLKPHVLSCKNRVIAEYKRSVFNREFLAATFCVFLLFSIYHGTNQMVSEMKKHPLFTYELAANLLHICLIAFFLLLLFSSCIAALNFFFTSKDLPLLITAPLSKVEIFNSRILLISANAGWMFVLFALPSIVGLATALELDIWFYLIAILSFIPFILIPTFLASIAIILLIGMVPAYRLRDALILLAFCGISLILYFAPAEQAHVSTEEAKVADLLVYLKDTAPPDLQFSPASLTKSLYYHAMTKNKSEMIKYSALLFLFTLILYGITLFTFSRLHPRGWNSTIQSGPAHRVYDSRIRELFGQIVFFNKPQLRALASKEWKLFFRDTTQSLQLLLLLTLTFVYLFNFRALRQGSQFTEDTFAWWHVVLSLANISFGTCVISAIATRFVFPSVSLEGRAYSILRNSPISFRQLLNMKFFIWFFPVAFLCSLLLVSGTWAIQAPIAAIIATGIISIALSVSIVGLGIGIGAVYARFDWETPAQVTASFGSLVFMLLALGTIFISSIPALFIFVLTCVPSFRVLLEREHYMFALAISYFLVFAINWIVARRALAAGAHRLAEMER